ncbi:MAG: hypothetical protein IAG13_12145 [Deltaproteobacteria bacterium]|nr:hypothetical protein [Nannocystaceae bacterium]
MRRWLAMVLTAGCGPSVATAPALDSGSGTTGSGDTSQGASSSGADGTSSAASSSDPGTSESGTAPPSCFREPSGETLGSLEWVVTESNGVYGSDVAWSPSAVFTIGAAALRRYEHDGELTWSTSWDGPGEYQTNGVRIAALQDGSLAAVYTTDTTWLVGFDDDGGERWRFELAQAASVDLFATASGVLVVGSRQTGRDTGFEQRLLDLDFEGGVLDDDRVTLELEYPYGIMQHADMDASGDVVLAGTVGFGVDRGWVLQLDAEHEQIAFEDVGPADDVAAAFTPESDLVVFAGEFGGKKILWRGELGGPREWEQEVTQVTAYELEVDCDGRIYLAFGAVTCYAPDGALSWISEDGADVSAFAFDPEGGLYTVGGYGTELALQLARIVAH